jgi:cytochrome c peroxidase
MKRLLLTTCFVAFTTAGVVGAYAADENPGLTLFKKGGCNECHSITALNVQKEVKKKAEGATEPAATAPATETKKKKTPPDLSGVGLEHDAKWISAFINKEETLNGEKHEKRFKGTEPDRRTLAMFLAGLKTKPEKTDAAPPTEKKEGQ